jgi:hypothetical protein
MKLHVFIKRMKWKCIILEIILMSISECWCSEILNLYSFHTWFCLQWNNNKVCIFLWSATKL